MRIFKDKSGQYWVEAENRHWIIPLGEWLAYNAALPFLTLLYIIVLVMRRK
jgi:hypothetical protein